MQIYQRLDLVVLLVYVQAMVLTSTAYYSKWSEWDSWTTCNSFCGIGNIERRRQCEDVVGRVADGCGDEEDSIEIAECFTQRCPLGSTVPTWTSWLAWSACDKTCGDGVTYSTRACLKETARGPVFSTICPGKNERTETCLLELCPTQGTPQVEGFRDWTDWDEWSSCIGKCGQRFRYRECYTYGQKFSRGCYGQTEEWEACGIPSCPKVKATPRPIYGILDYAEWTVWEQWTHCGRTCGGGKKYRKRDCKNKRNINSVLSYTACGGPDVEDLKCNTQLCPGQTPKPKKVILGSWTEWATWARCSRSCVGGTTSRWRSCQDKKANMVGDCKGEAMEYDDCGSALCTPAPFSSYGIPAPSIWPKNFAVWTEWEIWWDCTKTCGGGKTVRYRDCEENGKWMPGCPGTDTNRKECNTHSCSGQSAPPKPAKSPSSSQGSQSSSQSKSSTKQSTSGGAVSWASWSDWEKCSVSCDSGTRTRWRECNDANKNLASGCKGEYMDTGTCGSTPCQSASSSGSAKYSSSQSVSWASWSDWTKCSASCDGGSRSRWRECNDANRNLATGCEGEYMDDSDCGSSPCMSKSRTGAGDTPSRTGQSPKQSSSGSEVKAWSTWSDWSSCSATCGGGTRSRWRECEGPNQSLAADCEGDYMDSGDCGSQSCQSSFRSGSNQVSQNTGGLDRPIEEGIGEGGGGEGGDDWGAWDSWQSCTVTCGVGVRMRYRQCVIESCLGEDVDSEDCVADELCEDSTAISEFEAEEGKGVVISCLDSRFVEDHPGSKVVWSKNEQPVEMNDRFILVDTADLEIKRVEPDDEGVYVCAVLSGDKTFNRHVVLLKIHSKSGGGGDSVMQMIIPASIPLVALIVIVVVVICQRRSGTKASGGKAKSKKAKVKKSKRAKSKKTVSAEVIEEEDYEPEAVPSRPGVPPPPPPPPLFSMNNSNAADEWIYFDGSPPPPPESPPPPPPTITPPPPPTIEPPPIPTFIPPPPTVAPPPPPTYAPLPRQHPSSRNNSNAGNDGVWSYSFSSWPPPFPP